MILAFYGRTIEFHDDLRMGKWHGFRGAREPRTSGPRSAGGSSREASGLNMKETLFYIRDWLAGLRCVNEVNLREPYCDR
jgi:hypothetical protein